MTVKIYRNHEAQPSDILIDLEQPNTREAAEFICRRVFDSEPEITQVMTTYKHAGCGGIELTGMVFIQSVEDDRPIRMPPVSI